MAERGIQVKGLIVDNTIHGGTVGTDVLPISKVRRMLQTPDSDSSPERQIDDINNLRLQTPNYGGDDHDDDDPNDDPGHTTDVQINRRRNRGGDDEYSKEYRLVNHRNIIINTFTGFNLA